jgi:ketosteroid isomerase-like protein
MVKRSAFIVIAVTVFAVSGFAQNSNSPTARPRTADKKSVSAQTPKPVSTPKRGTSTPSPRRSETKPRATQTQTPGSDAVLAAFDALLDGIRHANVNAVTSIYWNSPRLVLFNNNGTITKGWEQMRKNRESSYRDLKGVKLDVRDVNVVMLGRDGAVVSCIWTQSQTYKDTAETASGRMTLVFRRLGNDWKAIHLHTSPDAPNPSRVLPSEQISSPTSSPAPSSSPSPTPKP